MPPQEVGVDNPAGPPPAYDGPPPAYDGTRVEAVQVKDDSTTKDQDGCCRKFTNSINRVLENTFASIGFTVATHPWKTILIALLISGLCMTGILEYKVENRGEKLWVSQSSDSLKHKDWVGEKFPAQSRPCTVMLERQGGNVLTRQSLEDLYELNEKVKKIEEGKNGTQWDDICFRTSGSCISNSILELWSYNLTKIQNLTKPEILAAVNQNNLRSPMTNKLMNIRLLVGGTVEMVNNSIVSASVARINIKIKKQAVFVKSKGQLVDEKGEQWEKSFDGVMAGQSTPGYTLYYFSEWGRIEAASNASSGDSQFFAIGYLLVIVYLAIMLGSFSRLGHKIYLAGAGITVIGLSVGISYGLGSALQLEKTAVHDVLAFLLLGIGVDDVFVIIQNWENIGGPKPDGRSIPEKISSTLRHAGVSILVTSLTDVCAFLIGASTILPALRSFSIWCAIGILAIFLLTITFFTAWLAIDASRENKRRDACLCCITLNDSWTPIACSEKSYLQSFIGKLYSPTLLTVPGKVIALIAVAGLLAGGSYGLANLKQDFNSDWFLPTSSAPRKFQINVKKSFPSNGITSAVYTGSIKYNTEYKAMNKIKHELESDSYIANGTVNSWFHHYKEWLDVSPYRSELNRTKECNESVIACQFSSDDRFYQLLDVFLNSSAGAFFKNNIRFSPDRKSVEAAAISFRHIVLAGAAKEIEAMDSVQEHIQPGLVASEPNSLLPFVYTFQYVGWETNKVITKELFRNVLLATLCVFLVTLFLLSNLWAALMVVSCVALALIDIAGFMHFWGITIDVVTTIIMVLAIGLTVDYSAHIAHGFMVSRKPTRNERMIDALSEIGPAVIHGGMSTMLAFVLLAASESYVFFTFFKVFFLVVVFGMFHGLVFLPVILSLLGPAPYAPHEADKTTKDNVATVVNKDEPIRLERMEQNGQVYVTEPGTNKAFTLE